MMEVEFVEFKTVYEYPQGTSKSIRVEVHRLTVDVHGEPPRDLHERLSEIVYPYTGDRGWQFRLVSVSRRSMFPDRYVYELSLG